jgi:hypothetical protein
MGESRRWLAAVGVAACAPEQEGARSSPVGQGRPRVTRSQVCELLCELPMIILHIFDSPAVHPAQLTPSIPSETAEMFARALAIRLRHR